MYKNIITLLLATLMALLLAACGGSDEPAQTETQGTVSEAPVEQVEDAQPDADAPQNGQPNRQRGGFESQYLTAEYEGAANPTTQLLLGTLQLEGTAQAVNTEQAAKLLPLWTALQGDAVTNQAERNAVFKQIEASMNAEQMQAIAELKLTNQSIGQWAEANGIELPQFGGRGGEGQDGEGQDGEGRGRGGPGGPGGGGPLADMTEEERAAFREEMQGLSQEEREARLAELGIEFAPGQGGRPGGGGPGGPGGGGPAGGRLGILMDPLIKMLTERSTG